MDTTIKTLPVDPFEAANLVYVKPLAAREIDEILPDNLRGQFGIDAELFAVHDASGNRLAIVEGREAAFEAARAHDLKPASLH